MIDGLIATGCFFGAYYLGLRAWRRFRDNPARLVLQASREFYNDARARGLSPKERTDESLMRIEMARVRRVASQRALADPAHGFEIMRAEIDLATERLASYDKGLAWVFRKASAGWLLPDCMNPDAVAAVMKVNKSTKISRFTPEFAADMAVGLRTPR